MSALIPMLSVDIQQNLQRFLEELEKHIPMHKLREYQLPKASAGRIERYVCPCSGGSDSTFLALLMRALFPSVHMMYVFTDTKAESPGVYENLNKLEKFLGISIERVTPENGLGWLCCRRWLIELYCQCLLIQEDSLCSLNYSRVLLMLFRH